MAEKLTVEDIEIPASILEYLNAAGIYSGPYMYCVKVALIALSEQPIVPSDADFHAMRKTRGNGVERRKHYVSEWWRNVFLRKTDPVPEEVKGLFWSTEFSEDAISHNSTILQAYKLGKAAR